MFNATSREEIEEFLSKDNHMGYLFELSTGVGKSRFSIIKMRQWINELGGRILIVIPKLVLINNWKTEFAKFGEESLLENVEFTTYMSLQKHVDTTWTCVCFDEVQHLSDRCKEIFRSMKHKHLLFLSATVKREIRDFILFGTRGIEIVRMRLREAIDNDVLPNPKVILVPLALDRTAISEVIVKNPKARNVVDVPYKDKRFCRDKNTQWRIHCTQQQWYDDIENMIDWLDKHATKMAYLKKCGDRNKWLSDKKTEFVKALLKRITRHRVIVFCNSIAQSKELGMNSINSKDGVAQDILDRFNRKEINKVTAVNILNEGVNVSDCKIGVFANLNSSEVMTVQRSGRILRHNKPVIIIPYYVNTRDEELMIKMIRNYDQEMIVKIADLNELKNHLR